MMDEPGQTMSYPNQGNDGRALASIASLLKDAENLLPVIRSEFRGEAMVQYDDGSVEHIQISKPLFVRTDFKTNKPIKISKKYKTGEKEIYVVNDEAVEEVVSMLKFMGLNKITNITNISHDTLMEDLLEFESKLSAVLAIKQKEWGIDKAMLPMTMTKVKTIVQDARHMALNGGTLRAIQKTVQRIEQSSEGDGKKSRRGNPYDFRDK